MRATNWGAETDPETVWLRAGGRRRYNTRRRRIALARVGQIIQLLGETGFHRGYQSEIARRLGVTRSTICRDMQFLRRLEQGWTLEHIYEVRRAERCYLHS